MIKYENQAQIIVEIRKLMVSEHVTQRGLAEKVGLSPQAFNKLLNKKNFCFEDAQRIIEAMGYQLVFDFTQEP